MTRLHTLAALALLSATSFEASAQFDLQLPLQYGAQQLWSNPAMLQDHHVTVMLPSVGGGFQTPIAVHDAGEVQAGKLVIDPDQLINRLAVRGNTQRFAANVETLGFNYRKGGWQAGFSHAARIAGRLDIPRGLIQLAAYGNAPYVGQELQVAPSVHTYAYQEFAVHGAYTFHDVFTVGGRVKYLNGTGALSTTSANASVYTDADYYETTITSNVILNSAGMPVSFSDSGIHIGDPTGLMGAGSGLGVDLGLVYQSGDKLQLGLSVRDMGSINWKGDAMQHRSNGTYTFSGYQGNVFEDGEAFEFDAAGTLDSVVGAMQFVSTAATFRTSLPTTVQATARYRLSPKTTLNGTLYSANAGVWQTGFGVGIGQQVGKVLHIGALTGLRKGGAYVGGNLLIDLWGPQLYVACDNLLTVFNLNEANDAYVRAGINLAFGEVKLPKAVRGFYDTKVEGINQ